MEGMDMLIQVMLKQEEFPLVIVKSFEMDCFVKSYHVYKSIWTPVIGEILTSERESGNIIDKYAVCVKKDNIIVGHLPLGKSGKFAKTIFYFLRADEESCCAVTITGKPVNLGNGDGMQVPCKLVFSGTEKCIEILIKNISNK